MATLTINNSACLDTIKFGLLYNYYAAADPRGLFATGWRLPTETEIDALATALGGVSVAGLNGKETGTVYWVHDYGLNLYGINFRGAGLIPGATGVYGNYQNYQYIMSSTPSTLNRIRSRYVSDGSDALSGSGLHYLKTDGMTIRPRKISTTLSNGESGTYEGWDGKWYRTICIGGIEWLADNLAETKFSNNDSLTEVNDAGTWSALTTEAYRAPNSDWGLV